MATNQTVVLAVSGLLALGVLGGAASGLIGGPDQVGVEENNEGNMGKAISYIAFCGDADSIDASGFVSGTSTSVSWTSSGGSVGDIVYKAGQQEYHIDVSPDASSGSFSSGEGSTVDIPPSDQDDPCAYLELGDLIEKLD